MENLQLVVNGKTVVTFAMGFLFFAIAGSACGGGDDTPSSTDLSKIVEEAKSQAAVTTVAWDPTPVKSGPTAIHPAATAVAQPTKVVRAPAPPPPAQVQTVNGMQHRGQGSFATGEAVIGYEIAIGGLRYRQCYFSQAPGNGTVTDGVVNPWPGEIIYSACGGGVVDPDTVNGLARRGPGAFTAGEAVVGYEIVINGLRYRLCYMASAPGNGTISDGVINPFKAEVKYPLCGQGVVDPDTVNGLARRGPGNFTAGEAVTGFFVLNGRQFGNCYLASAPSAGTVTDGVINPWSKETANVPVCK